MNLAKKLRTYDNAVELKYFVEDLKLNLSKDKRKSVKSVLEEESNGMKDLFLDLLNESNISISDSSAVTDFLGDIINKINNFERVNLVVAVDPDEDLIKTVADWIQDKVDKSIILKIDVDPDILGGIKVTYKGKYLDLSLNNKLNGIFKSKDILKI